MSFNDMATFVDLGGKNILCKSVYTGFSSPDLVAYNTTLPPPLSSGSGSSPAGSNGQVQYNNGGVMGGLTSTQLTADINQFTNTTAGVVPASGGGTANFMRADGTWATPAQVAGGTNGQVQYNNAGILGGLTNAQLTAQIQNFTATSNGGVPASGGGTSNFLRADGNFSVPPTVPAGSSGQVQYNNSGVMGGLTNTQLTADINVFTTALKGATPASGGGTSNFLRADGTWAVPPGGSASPGGSSGQVQYNNSGAFGGLTNTQLTADINVFTSSLSGAVPASGGGTTNFMRADGTWAAPSGGGGTSLYYNVKTYGATGNGVTDDTTAINNAQTALNAAGGGVLYFPAGTYLCGGLDIASNTTVMGDGMDATTIVNNGSNGNFETLNIAWTMSGGSYGVNWPTANTTYLINTPTTYSNQVTLTTPSQASNFTVGKWAMVSGGLQGTSFWFPSWWSKVTAVNTSTGVITLEEMLPFEGALLNTIQVVTAIPSNIQIRDMTLVAGLDSCVSAFGMENVLVENVKFYPWLPGGSPAGSASNGLCVLGQAKNSGMRNCVSHAYGYELFGANNCFMEGCKTYEGQYNNSGATPGGTLLIDGGSADISITNNYIIASPNAPANTNWIEIENSPVRVKVIGNTITGMPDSSQGISITDNAQLQNGLNVSAPFTDQNNNNIVMGNTILGYGTQTTSIGISMTSGSCIGNILENVALGMFGTNTANIFFDGNTFKNVNDQGWYANPPGQLGAGTAWTSTQAVGQKTLTSGTATPSVAGNGFFSVFQNSAQTITNLVPFGVTNEIESQAGQEITLFFGDHLTTLSHAAGGNGQMNFQNGAGFNPVQNSMISFILNPFGVWLEKWRSVVPGTNIGVT